MTPTWVWGSLREDLVILAGVCERSKGSFTPVCVCGCVPIYLVRVPVRVEDDHGVSRLQVEAQPPRPRAEQEDEVLGGRVVERLQQHAAVLRLGGAWGGGAEGGYGGGRRGGGRRGGM